MDTIKVVIRKDTGAIEITPELVEQALNFYFGMDASVTVFAAVEQNMHPTVLCTCGADVDPFLAGSNKDCPAHYPHSG